MAFEKGQSGNPNGRPKGSKNRNTENLRIIINNFLFQKFDPVTQAFDDLSARDKVKAYVDLLHYGLPKLQAESSNEFENMTEEQLNKIISTLKATI